MAEFLADIGTFFSQSMDWMADVLEKVIASPALLVLVLAMPICSFAVGLLGRLIRM